MYVSDIGRSKFAGYIKTEQTDGEIINQPTEAEAANSGAPQKAIVPPADIVEISDEGRQKVRESQNNAMQSEGYYEDLMKQLKEAQKQGEAQADGMRVLMKCHIIALRIMTGDEVPKEDHSYLLKHDRGLYAKAIMMRMEKENPQKHKRLSEDEEDAENDGGDTDEVSGGGRVSQKALPEVEASPADIASDITTGEAASMDA